MMKRTDLRRLRGAARKTGRLLALPATLLWALAGTAAAYDSGDVAAVLAGTGRPGADLSHADLSGADLSGLNLRGANLAGWGPGWKRRTWPAPICRGPG